MTIEYMCTNEKCKYTFLDVLVIPMCRCPKCGTLTDHLEWEGLPGDD